MTNPILFFVYISGFIATLMTHLYHLQSMIKEIALTALENPDVRACAEYIGDTTYMIIIATISGGYIVWRSLLWPFYIKNTAMLFFLKNKP